MDRHHVAGKANSPVTISVPVNDHRARLNDDQYDWLFDTLENPDGSPLLMAAACIQGFIDVVLYLIEKLLTWIADLLCALDAHLKERLGPKWWLNTEIENAVPKGWPNESE